MATVDVIIPFYNTRLSFLTQAIASLRAQTLTDWHACIVNDGSDDTASVALERHLAEIGDNRFAYRRIANRGTAAARNVALGCTQSPYVALLDADDRYHPDMLQAHVDFLERNPNIDVVYADHEVIDAAGAVIESGASVAAGAGRNGINGLSPTEQFTRMAARNFISCITTVFRRRCLADGVRFDETPDSIEDKMFWLSLLGRGARFHYLNKTVAQYRRHGANTSCNVDKLLRGRKHLFRTINAMAPTHSEHSGKLVGELRRTIWRHMFAEAAYGYRHQRRYLHAAYAYCLQHGYILSSLFKARPH